MEGNIFVGFLRYNFATAAKSLPIMYLYGKGELYSKFSHKKLVLAQKYQITNVKYHDKYAHLINSA